MFFCALKRRACVAAFSVGVGSVVGLNAYAVLEVFVAEPVVPDFAVRSEWECADWAPVAVSCDVDWEPHVVCYVAFVDRVGATDGYREVD